MKWLVLAFTYALGLFSLMSVFALYLQPEFVFNLAKQVWSCF